MVRQLITERQTTVSSHRHGSAAGHGLLYTSAINLCTTPWHVGPSFLFMSQDAVTFLSDLTGLRSDISRRAQVTSRKKKL